MSVVQFGQVNQTFVCNYLDSELIPISTQSFGTIFLKKPRSAYMSCSCFLCNFCSPLVREFLSIDNPRNASVHDDDENETNGINHENSESLVSTALVSSGSLWNKVCGRYGCRA